MRDAAQLTARLNRDWAMGRAAYEAHSDAVGENDVTRWEDLATRVQNAWIAAAHAGRQEYVEE